MTEKIGCRVQTTLAAKNMSVDSAALGMTVANQRQNMSVDQVCVEVDAETFYVLTGDGFKILLGDGSGAILRGEAP